MDWTFCWFTALYCIVYQLDSRISQSRVFRNSTKVRTRKIRMAIFTVTQIRQQRVQRAFLEIMSVHLTSKWCLVTHDPCCPSTLTLEPSSYFIIIVPNMIILFFYGYWRPQYWIVKVCTAIWVLLFHVASRKISHCLGFLTLSTITWLIF